MLFVNFNRYGTKERKSNTGSGKRFMVTVKNEIIAKQENGIRVSDSVKKYIVAKSFQFLKIKKDLRLSKWLKEWMWYQISKQRSKLLDGVEKLLLILINEKQLAGDGFNEGKICVKWTGTYWPKHPV